MPARSNVPGVAATQPLSQRVTSALSTRWIVTVRTTTAPQGYKMLLTLTTSYAVRPFITSKRACTTAGGFALGSTQSLNMFAPYPEMSMRVTGTAGFEPTGLGAKVPLKIGSTEFPRMLKSRGFWLGSIKLRSCTVAPGSVGGAEPRSSNKGLAAVMLTCRPLSRFCVVNDGCSIVSPGRGVSSSPIFDAFGSVATAFIPNGSVNNTAAGLPARYELRISLTTGMGAIGTNA